MKSITTEEIAELVIKALESQKSSPNEEQGGTSSNQKIITYSEDPEMGVINPNNRASIERAQSITPARIGIGRAGTRMRTSSYLRFRIDHAAAQDAVTKDVSEEMLKQLGLPILETVAADMNTYLMSLDAGRNLSPSSIDWLEQNVEKGNQVQILVCDGLSSSAVESNIPDMLPALMQGLKLKNIRVGPPLFVKRARVWVQDQVASIVKCDLIISLIGERPGLATDESLSAYMIYRPNEQSVEADRTVISNIHRGGLSSVEAGAYLSDLIADMLKSKCSGVKFSQKRHHVTDYNV
jgi:ethanolamine ammonia-lyase small subunit